MLLGIYINVFFQITREGSSPERETLYFVEVNRCSTIKEVPGMQPQLVKLIRDTRAGWGKHADPGLAGKELFRGGRAQKVVFSRLYRDKAISQCTF